MEDNQPLSISVDLENNTMIQNTKKAEIQTPTTQSVVSDSHFEIILWSFNEGYVVDWVSNGKSRILLMGVLKKVNTR